MLDRLLAGTLPWEPRQQVLAHVAAGCELCLRYIRIAVGETAGGAAGPSLAAVGGALGRPRRGRRRPWTARGREDLETVAGLEVGAYDAALAGGLERSAAGIARIQADRLDAVELWTALQDVPRPRRPAPVTGGPRVPTLARAAR